MTFVHLAVLPSDDKLKAMDSKTLARYEARAQVFKALAHPSRLLIVDELIQSERCVCDLTALVGSDMSTVSKHLSVLKAAGVVQDERRGSQIWYRLRMKCVTKFFSCVEGELQKQAREQWDLVHAEYLCSSHSRKERTWLYDPSAHVQDHTDLMFSCSGAADIAEIGDRAVRVLHKAGEAKMFCLAGIAGKVELIEVNTRGADRMLVVDGCDSDCAKKTMEFGGFTDSSTSGSAIWGWKRAKPLSPMSASPWLRPNYASCLASAVSANGDGRKLASVLLFFLFVAILAAIYVNVRRRSAPTRRRRPVLQAGETTGDRLLFSRNRPMHHLPRPSRATPAR